MRQLGTIANERDAQRFAAWLTAQRIDAHAEQESEGWSIWVRDEDQLPKAREALAHFQSHPGDQRYQGAERAAEALIRDEAEKRRQSQKNVVEMRGRWGSPGSIGGASRRCPLVLAMIAVSIIAFLFTWGDGQSQRQAQRFLAFVDPIAAVEAGARRTREGEFQPDRFASLRAGELWRLITPIFLHADLMHLAMNMLVLFSFGGQVEDRRGSVFVAVVVLLLAATSNFGQAYEMSLRDLPQSFGGMSGVGYGLFGYLLVKTKFDNRDGYFLAPTTTFILLLWFFLCIGGQFPPLNGILPESITHVANSAHAVGLFMGMAIAYAPLLVRKPA